MMISSRTIYSLSGRSSVFNRYEGLPLLERVSWCHRRGVIRRKTHANRARPQRRHAADSSPSPERERAGVRADFPPHHTYT